MSSALSRSRTDRWLVRLLRCTGLVSGTVLLLIVAFLVHEALPAVRHVGLYRFLQDSSWHPAPDAAKGQFNLTPMLAGTAIAAFGAVLLSAPLGFLSGIFCQFYAPPFIGTLYRRMLELLAGIPSVVFGFWGLVVLVPQIARWQPPGTCLLAAIIVLALMILPMMALAVDAAIAAIPAEQLQAAAALGLTRWGTLRAVILPGIRSEIITALVLQTGRALGETIAVVMVCGNVVQWPDRLLKPTRTLTANIALEMAYATGDHRSALFASALLLLCACWLLIVTGQRMRWRSDRA